MPVSHETGVSAERGDVGGVLRTGPSVQLALKRRGKDLQRSTKAATTRSQEKTSMFPKDEVCEQEAQISRNNVG